MSVEMVEFKAQLGKLYVAVVVESLSDTLIDVNMMMTSIQRRQSMSGIVEFYIHLENDWEELHHLYTSYLYNIY